MRVAYLCVDPGVPVFGTKGSSVHVQEILRSFLARGDEVVVYCARRGDAVPRDLAGVRVVERRVRADGPAEREHVVARTAEALAASVVADGCDLVYERYSLFSRAGALISEGLGVPVVVEVNSPLIDEQRGHRVLVDAVGAEASTRAVLSTASVVACVSTPVAEWAAGHGAHRPLVVPNGVNTARIRPSHPTDRPFTVGFVGTLKPWHGVELLIEAVALQHRRGGDIRLIIVGDGPEGPSLRELAQALDLDARFVGSVPPERMPEVLGSFDVGIAPYPRSAGEDYFSPLKVYEYLAAGLPVIASAVGQIPTVIRDGENGILLEPGDIGALATAMDDLARDEEVRRRMSRTARADAVARHDWSRVLEQILERVPAPEDAAA